MVTDAGVSPSLSRARFGSRFPAFSVSAAAWLGVILVGANARADVSSWFYAGGGMTSLEQFGMPHRTPGTLQLELGVGSSPDTAVVIGGLVKTLTQFGSGTDLGFVARVASGSFVRGNWGIAADAGMYQRWWGDNSTGFLGQLVLGAPYGFQLAALTEQGSDGVHAYGATFGIDFLRLTVYRTAGQQYWPNPFPAPHVGSSR